MPHTLVSVVTVCRNAERHIAGAMESVLEQSYPNIEYVVVDGGSTDGTLDVIRAFEPRFEGRMRWTSGPDAGIYDAMNTGIARCSGEIIGLLNADDEYPPDAIDWVVRSLEEHPGVGAVFGDAVILDEDGGALRVEKASVPARGVMPARMPMCHQALFVAKGVYESLGTYDTSYRILADYDFVLRLMESGVEMVHVDAPLARFRLGGACGADMAVSTAERERIRVAHGANPLVERVRRARHAVNRFVYAVLAGKGTTTMGGKQRRSRRP